MSLIAVPTTDPTRIIRPARRWIWALPAVVLATLAVGYWTFTRAGTSTAAGAGAAFTGGQFYMLAPQDLEVKVSQKGELQAVNNIDIVCQVEGQTTITTLVKEGTSVKKGQVLVTLDSSTIKQKIEDSTLDVQKADADL